jgi:hypothetical protein
MGSFVTRAFFLDKAIDHRAARIAQYLGLGFSVIWVLLLAVHFVSYRKLSLLLLGLVTLALWIILWRIGFLMMASYYRWKL